MTEAQLRKKVVETAKSYLGEKEGGKEHKEIIRMFNTVKPDGAAMTTSAPWCAAFSSAMEIKALGKADAKKICPLSYNCGTIISKAKKLGCWIENDKYKPKEADWILYDWQDSGKGDNTGGADHVGIVETVKGSEIVVIEGNKNDRVERRTLKINGRYIRGYVAIPYGKIADNAQTKTVSKTPSKTPAKATKTIKVGSTIKLKKGANQYGKTRDFASFVYDRKYKVVEIRGNRVVFADGKIVIGAVSKNDCIVQ